MHRNVFMFFERLVESGSGPFRFFYTVTVTMLRFLHWGNYFQALRPDLQFTEPLGSIHIVSLIFE